MGPGPTFLRVAAPSNNAINLDGQKQRSFAASLLPTGYGERSAVKNFL